MHMVATLTTKACTWQLVSFIIWKVEPCFTPSFRQAKQVLAFGVCSHVPRRGMIFQMGKSSMFLAIPSCKPGNSAKMWLHAVESTHSTCKICDLSPWWLCLVLHTCLFLLFNVKQCTGSFIVCKFRTVLLLLVVLTIMQWLSERDVQATAHNKEL